MKKCDLLITCALGILTLSCDGGRTVGYQPHVASRQDLIGTWWGQSWAGYHIEVYGRDGRYVNKTYSLRTDGSEWVKERDTGTWSFIGDSLDIEIVRHSCWFCENLAGLDTPFVKGDCLHEKDTVAFLFFDNFWLRDDWSTWKWRKIKEER